MADITKAIVTADGTVTNLIDPTTRQSVNYKPVTVWYDGTPMTNAKCDGRLYCRKDSTYYKQVIDKDGELFLEKDTMAQFRTLSTWELLLVKSGVVKGIRLNGYYEKGDTPAPIEYYLSDTTELDNSGSIISINNVKFEHDFKCVFPVVYFGAKGDDSFDNTDIINTVKILVSNKSVQNRGIIFFHSGIYRYNDLGRVSYKNVVWKGENMESTILKSMSGDIAFNEDGDLGYLPNETFPFVFRGGLQDITIKGNPNTKIIWKQNLIAMGEYYNVTLLDANNVDGIALQTASVSSTFENIICSTNKDIMSSVPNLGLNVVEGFRHVNGVLTSIGRATNNIFINTHWAGMPKGILITGGDINVFQGGSPQANTEYCVTITTNNKGNRFVGVGFESKNAPYEIYDGGWMTIYSNCYSSNKVIWATSSRNVEWQGGQLAKVKLENAALRPVISNCFYNYYSVADSDLFVDEGAINPRYNNVYNRANGTFLQDFQQIYNENTYSTKYTLLSSAAGATNVGGIQEFIELNYTGSQSVNFQQSNSSTSFAVGIRKTFRKNAAGLTTITPASGVTFNGTTNPVTISEINEQFIFICTGLNTWRYYRINSNNATIGTKGVVNQSAAVTNSTVADATDLPTAIALVNDLKAKLNAKLTNDRTSGQQA